MEEQWGNRLLIGDVKLKKNKKVGRTEESLTESRLEMISEQGEEEERGVYNTHTGYSGTLRFKDWL